MRREGDCLLNVLIGDSIPELCLGSGCQLGALSATLTSANTASAPSRQQRVSFFLALFVPSDRTSSEKQSGLCAKLSLVFRFTATFLRLVSQNLIAGESVLNW